MIEIIALIFLTRNMGNLAEQKGLKPGQWKLYTVLAWVGAEIIGVIIGMLLVPDNILIAMLIGITLAICSYFILKSNLNNRPDAGMEHDIDQIGVDDLRPPRQH